MVLKRSKNPLLIHNHSSQLLGEKSNKFAYTTNHWFFHKNHESIETYKTIGNWCFSSLELESAVINKIKYPHNQFLFSNFWWRKFGEFFHKKDLNLSKLHWKQNLFFPQHFHFFWGVEKTTTIVGKKNTATPNTGKNN